jgi:hypothetical protein
MASSTNLLTFDWGAEVPDEERDRIIDRFIKLVRRYRLETPTILFLETIAPMSFLGGQGVVLFSPFLAPLFPAGLHDVQRISKLLDSPDNVRLLIDRIAEDAPEQALDDTVKPTQDDASEGEADAARK